jgi:hypothetical protein
MNPKRVYDQIIWNFPCPLWFREVSDEDFNPPDAVAAKAPIPPPPLLPTRPSAGRQVEPAGVETDCGAEVEISAWLTGEWTP